MHISRADYQSFLYSNAESHYNVKAKYQLPLGGCITKIYPFRGMLCVQENGKPAKLGA
jgi:hypothetical protein